MPSVDACNNNDPSPQTDDTMKEKALGSPICMADTRHILSQALNAAAKETSSADSIVDGNEMSTNGNDKRKADAIDRFFGFAERLICSADNTTNVEMDPRILIAQERSSLFVCGDEEKIVETTVHTETIVEETTEGEISPPQPQDGDDTTKLQKKASDDTGSTAADSVVGVGVTVTLQNKPRFWTSLYCCIGKDIEESVVYNESIQVST